MSQKCNADGIRIIQSCESCRLTAYPDPGTGGIPWTIGWGKATGVHPGMTCTQAEADCWLREDVSRFEGLVSRLVKVPLTENQFSALVSFAYNVPGFPGSTLLKLLNQGDHAGAATEFPKWNHAGGKVLAGLTKRRAMERELFLKV